MSDELVDRNIRRQTGSTHSLTWFERAIGKVYGLLGAPERYAWHPGCAGDMTSCSRRNVPRSAMRDGVLTVLATYSPHRLWRRPHACDPFPLGLVNTVNEGVEVERLYRVHCRLESAFGAQATEAPRAHSHLARRVNRPHGLLAPAAVSRQRLQSVSLVRLPFAQSPTRNLRYALRPE